MALALARTIAEAEIYMDLHSCEVCGGSAFDHDPVTVSIDGVAASRYAGACPRCGTHREFTFRLPDDPLCSGDVDEASFGRFLRGQLEVVQRTYHEQAERFID